jgi:hypothetical protein
LLILDQNITLGVNVVSNDVAIGVHYLIENVRLEGVPSSTNIDVVLSNSAYIGVTYSEPLANTLYIVSADSLQVGVSFTQPTAESVPIVYNATADSLHVGVTFNSPTAVSVTGVDAATADSLSVGVTFNEPTAASVSAATLLAHYPLAINSDEALGTTIGINGVDTSITYDGTSADFTTASKIVVPDNDIFSITDGTNDIAKTIEFEMMIDSLTPSTSNYFVSKSLSNSNREFLCSLSTTLHLRMWMWNVDNSGRILTDADATGVIIAANTFYKIKYTYDGSKLWTGIKIYVDDVELATTNLNSGTYVGQTNTVSDLCIGQMQSFPTPKFEGRMKNLKFYNGIA